MADQLFMVMVGILLVIVLIGAIIGLRRRRASARRGGHIMVDMARPETIAETGVPETRENADARRDAAPPAGDAAP